MKGTMDEKDSLSPEEFDALLASLDSDREKAGEKYESIRRRLIRLFEWRGCDTSEELADETINRVARRMAEGVKLQRDPYGYFCGVAHLVYKEVLRRDARQRKAYEPGNWPPPATEEEQEDRRLECLRRCLAGLPEDQRRLVLLYHQEDDHIRSREELRRELGIEMNALRIRVHRVRKKLETCVQDCLRR